MENVLNFYHLVQQVIQIPSPPLPPPPLHAYCINGLHNVSLLHLATFCEMDGAQDVILSLNDDEASEKSALRICYQCHDLLLK